MELTILGSGCGIPSLERSAPGVLIRIKDQPLLFDSGPGTLVRLLKAGVDYKNLEHVFYTHTHSDHCADLVPLIQALWTTPDFKKIEPLHLYGPAGFLKFLQTLSQAFGSWVIDPPFPLFIQELQSEKLEFSDFSVECRPMKHSAYSIGYRIENKTGSSIVYSGDTDYNNEIIELAHNADVLILECSFPEKRKIGGHLIPKEAAKIAAISNCKQLILTHFYPPYEEVETEIYNIIPEIYKEELFIAHDFFRLIV